MHIKEKFTGENENVIKYILTTDTEDILVEAVLYNYGGYETRTVLCISTQCGCPVGCVFCGTGNKFIRNLTPIEITSQVIEVFKDADILMTANNSQKLQIMFMSMGEPLLNWKHVSQSITMLHYLFPAADLLISTIAPRVNHIYKKLNRLAKDNPKVGLQFSIHEATDHKRNRLIPYAKKLALDEIASIGQSFHKETGRQAYLNYVITGSNNSHEHFLRLTQLFKDTAVFAFTFSVLCSTDDESESFRDLDVIRAFEQKFIDAGYNTRVFDPAGQDDIGGGCGQLWYVQEWMMEQE